MYVLYDPVSLRNDLEIFDSGSTRWFFGGHDRPCWALAGTVDFGQDGFLGRLWTSSIIGSSGD